MLEKLAAEQHAIWSHWMRYLFEVSHQHSNGAVVISADKASRWRRQVETQYCDLTTKEQASDIEQAQKVLAILGDETTQLRESVAELESAAKMTHGAARAINGDLRKEVRGLKARVVVLEAAINRLRSTMMDSASTDALFALVPDQRGKGEL